MASASPALTNAPWWHAPAIIEDWNGVQVVRDDLLHGGSKMRFLPFLVEGQQEIVYGGPFCGGAPYALSVWGKRMGVKVTLFFAKRKTLHWRQRAAFRNGATIYQVPAGRMSVVQHRSRTYAEKTGALFLPLGFDVKDATRPFEEAMRGVRQQVGKVDEVWCAVGTGMLARCLAVAFPDAAIKGVVVGLRSRNQAQDYPANVQLLDCPYDFAEDCSSSPPFPSCMNYEAKAWEQMRLHAKGRVLFWNVVAKQTAPEMEADQR